MEKTRRGGQSVLFLFGAGFATLVWLRDGYGGGRDGSPERL